MRRLLAALFLALGCLAIAADKPTPEPADIGTAEYLDGEYIPKDLEDCFRVLKREMPPEELTKLKAMPEDQIGTTHFGLGMGVRNGWGLWRGSRLAVFFRESGIDHVENMSGIITYTFWRHLHGQPTGFEEIQADFAQGKAKALVIRKLVLIDARLGECVEFLAQKSRLLDSYRTGLHIEAAEGVDISRRISLEAENMTIHDALQKLADLSGTKLVVRGHKLLLMPGR